MTQYSAYPRYVTTGCDWFPRIPEHWILDRAKWAVISCQNGVWGSEPDGDDDLVCIRVADFDRQSLTISTTNLTMRSIPYKDRNTRLLKNGDLLIEKSGGGDQQLVGAVVEYNQDFPAVSSNFVARMEVNDNTDSRFIVYVHSHLYSGRVNYRSIKQTTGIQNLDSSAYLNEIIAYPPLDEQKSIARFLDHKTAQIDALIAKKQLLLDKLAEQRTALISQAVTKGLDPSVTMKDSGVEWLGEIPKHWRYKRLKFLVSVLGGGTPNTSKPEYWNGDIPWVSPKDMKHDFINTTEDYLTEKGVEESATRLINSNAVLIVVRSGILRHTIPVARNTCLVSLNQDMKALITNTELNPGYLHWFINGLQKGLLPLWSKPGCTVESIELNYLLNTLIPLPPHGEQQQIEDYVANIRDDFNNRLAKVEEVIQRLQEYRAALITNAVTGKIDVRDFRLPTSTEQRELAHG